MIGAMSEFSEEMQRITHQRDSDRLLAEWVQRHQVGRYRPVIRCADFDLIVEFAACRPVAGRELRGYGMTSPQGVPVLVLESDLDLMGGYRPPLLFAASREVRQRQSHWQQQLAEWKSRHLDVERLAILQVLDGTDPDGRLYYVSADGRWITTIRSRAEIARDLARMVDFWKHGGDPGQLVTVPG